MPPEADKCAVVSFLVGLFVFSCAPPVIKTTALAPPNYPEAAQLKEVAVLPFDGPGGREFSAEVEAALASSRIGDKQYFTVVERAKIDKIIEEMKFSQSALTDPTTAVKIGKLLGVKGIYMGVAGRPSVNDEAYKEERTTCAYYQTKYDKKGRPYEVCAKYMTYTVNCTRRIATFTFVPKLVEVESGRIVYSRSISGSATSSACEDRGSLKSGPELIRMAKEKAIGEFKRDTAPYYVTFDIKLMKTGDIKNKAAEEKMEKGIEFAKAGRLDRACELWNEAAALSPESPSILYHLGVCAEVTGNLNQALELYTKADRLLDKPDDALNSAIMRVKGRIEKQKKLEELLK